MTSLIGFQSSLGCQYTKMEVGKKKGRKCSKLEGKLAACDYTCNDVKTEAPTKGPTKSRDRLEAMR